MMAEENDKTPGESLPQIPSEILSEIGADACFTATPLVRSRAPSPSTTRTNDLFNEDPTFIQNQIAIQRSSSTTKEHASALTRQLSLKSNGSHDLIATPTVIANIISAEEDRGRGRAASGSSLIQATNKCTLSKSSSNRSEKSAKSVRSVHAVGSYPLGCLRLHSPSPTPTSTRNQPDVSLKSGDVFIVRDVPAGSLIGYDTIAFTVKVNESFDGVKDIPPGVHFIWGGSNTSSLRNGFWIVSSSRASEEYGTIHVRRWDKESEVIEEEVSKAEIRIQKEGLSEIFDKLQPYMISTPSATAVALAQQAAQPTQFAAKDPNLWLRLVSSVTGSLLNRITGNKGWNNWQVCSVHDHLHKTPSGSNPEITMDYRDEVLRFTIPQYKRTFSDESLGRARTEQAMDSTSHILKIISKNCSHENADEIVGEIQFCFITGMLLGNVACMEQWTHVVKMVFGAYDLVLQMPDFFRKFIEAVHAQFIYDDEGLEGSILDYEPSLSDDLKLILTKFKARLNEMLLELGAKITCEQSAVGKAFGELETLLWKWDWDLRANYVRSGKYQLEDGQWIDAELKDFQAEDERGEFAPVMVELDDDGREKGLIHF